MLCGTCTEKVQFIPGQVLRISSFTATSYKAIQIKDYRGRNKLLDTIRNRRVF